MNLSDRLRRWFGVDGAPVGPALGATPIRSCEPRSRVRVAGRITTLRTNPDTGWFEAELRDDTGAVRLIWMARETITVLREGSLVVASGRLAERDGGPVIYNPAFSVVPD